MTSVKTKRAFWLAILVLSGLQLMVVLDGTVVILALPRLQNEMGFGSSGSAWTITAYGLPFAGLMLLGGRIGDSFGRRRAFILGVAMFTLASLCCGLAQNEFMLLAARAVQGTGAALAAPTAFALVASTFPPGKERNKAFAIFGSMVALGSVSGLVIGGALTQASWRWIFLINVPIGLLIVTGARRALRDTDHHRLAMDARGAVIGTLACGLVVFGAIEGPEMRWDNPIIYGSLLGGLVLLLVFVLGERYVANPLLPWSLFTRRDRVATFVVILLSSGVLGATTYFTGLFVQNVVGYTPLTAGVSFIPFTIGVGAGSAVASKLAMRIAPRWLLVPASVIMVTGLLYGSTLTGSVAYFSTLLPLFVVIGFGIGIAMVLIPLCVLVGVGAQDIGPLSAIGQMFLNLGTPIAIGILTPFAASRTLAEGGRIGNPAEMNHTEIAALGAGYTLVLFVAALGAAAVGIIALTLRYTASEVARAHHLQEESNALEDPTTAPNGLPLWSIQRGQ